MHALLLLGAHEVGVLETVEVDHFWTYGKFRQGRHFSLIAELVARLERAYSDAEAIDETADADTIQEEVDKLGLEMKAPNGTMVRVRGFKIEGACYECRMVPETTAPELQRGQPSS